MLNIKLLIQNPKEAEARLQTKDPSISLKPLLESYNHYLLLKQDLETKQNVMNQTAKEIGTRKQQRLDTSDLFNQVDSLKKEIQEKQHALAELESTYLSELSILPNLPDADSKVALNPKDNECIKTFKKMPQFDFPIKNHLELSEIHDILDFKRGAKLSGTGWPVYSEKGARLEWALLNLMMDIHFKNGFSLRWVPHLVKPEVMYGSGQLPKFKDQAFKVEDEDYHLYLLPTAEVALNGLHIDEIFAEEDLPCFYVAYTPCFRREAGAHGKNERGLIRVHQFNKVEMFAFTTPEESDRAFEKMLSSAEEILETLELHYRNMRLVTGDMSYAASKTVDIEVFLPGQDRYYEVSSVSNCRDFQARRSKIRYKKDQKQNEYVHTLNGSGLATARLLVALLENNQQKDGSIKLPKALAKYYGADSL